MSVSVRDCMCACVCLEFVEDQTDKQANKHKFFTVWPIHTYCLQNEPKTYTLLSGQSQDSIPHSCIFGSLILDNKIS